MSAELITNYDEFDEWAKYERLKAELPHDLSQVEYERACQMIADELGI